VHEDQRAGGLAVRRPDFGNEILDVGHGR
jgi:hypothetical protein